MNDPTDTYTVGNSYKYDEYTLSICSSDGKVMTMIGKDKVCNLKDRMPEISSLADILVLVAGKDFEIEYNDGDLTKSGKFKKLFVKKLFDKAFEIRISPMVRVIIEDTSTIHRLVENMDYIVDRMTSMQRIVDGIDINYHEFEDDLDNLMSGVESLKDDLAHVARNNLEPTKDMELRLIKRIDAALEKMEERFYAATGRRKLMVTI